MTLAAPACPWNPSLPLGLRDKEDDPQAVQVEVLTPSYGGVPVSAWAWPELCPVGPRVPPLLPPHLAPGGLFTSHTPSGRVTGPSQPKEDCHLPQPAARAAWCQPLQGPSAPCACPTCPGRGAQRGHGATGATVLVATRIFGFGWNSGSGTRTNYGWRINAHSSCAGGRQLPSEAHPQVLGPSAHSLTSVRHGLPLNRDSKEAGS